MDKNLFNLDKKRIERTAAALEKAGFTTYCTDTAKDALSLIESLVPQNAICACGGSMSLSQAGVTALLQSGKYQYLDRAREGITAEEIGKVYRDTFSADYYFSSANAVTENGEIVNMDGNANRVAAITFGPSNVILLVGANKIVKNQDDAIRRIKEVAAPANAMRLGCKTPCAVTGKCEDCHSPSCICCTMTVQRNSRPQGRIKVILVAESLGY
ncbi:MAG: lactate utilization protein [Oscillospiraceae bacterium]